MKIRRLRVEGFGGLCGEFIFSSDRCNLVLEPNESGKTTLAEAILAALYGFPRQRSTRDQPITLRERFRPWGGGRYAVEIEMECRDRAYIVRRDLEKDSAAVYDALSGKEITEEFSQGKDQLEFGEAITGLSRDDFARCCFVGQRAADALGDLAGLTHALQRIASSQRGDVASGEALAVLSAAVDQDYKGMRLGKGKVDTEIKRLGKEIDELRSEMAAIAARRRESEGRIRSLEEATVREGRAESDLARADYLHLLAARAEASASLAQCQHDEEEIRAYQAELADLKDFAGFPAEKLGALRELKGKLESLTRHREAAERRLRTEVEEPLRRAESALRSAGRMADLTDEEIARASERQAVLADLWEQRREKRQALRRERRRLRESGTDPDRASELAAAFSGLGEEDRRFLSGHRERTLELRASLGEADRQRERLLEAEGGESPALVSLAKARRTESMALVAGVVGFAATILMFLSVQSKVPAILVGALSLASFIWWILRQETRPIPGAEEFGSDLQRVQTSLWALEKETAALADRLANLAARLDYPKPDQLLEEFKELQQLEDRAAPMTGQAALLQEAQGRYAAAASDLREIMQRADRSPAHGAVTPRSARRFLQNLTECSRTRVETAALSAQREEAELDLAATDEEIASLRAEASVTLASGLEENEPMADFAASLELFEDAASKRERHDRLRDELLPAAERRNAVPPAERAAQLHVDIEVLSRQIDRAVRQDPGLRGLAPERSSREYAEERRRLQEEARSTQQERQALSEELGDVLKEYRREYPGRQSMLAKLEASHARAVAFRDAVAVASEVLASISREAYAEWAEILNEKTSEILRRLNPRYEDVRFDTDLSFTVRETRSGERRDRAAIDAHFSSGARDQIYLAVRMALSEYLSAAGERLPFIMDDPFASFDDQRFAQAMEFLLNTLGRRHQVLMFSCHEVRHRAWRESAPESLVDRSRVLDLTPLPS